MDLSKLKSFVTVAEELNFRKSAERLGMSQPPLTRLIAALEAELGTPLFERTTRQVKLTAAGVYLLKEGREILGKAESLEHDLRLIGKMKTGKLSVGFSIASFLASLPRMTNAFQERFPKINMELRQSSPAEILKGLKSGRFDLAFAEGKTQIEGHSSIQVRDEVLGVLLPKKHRLARRKSLELSELEPETVILHPRKESKGFYDTIMQLFAQHGIKPKTYVKEDGESCPFLVATGHGVSLTLAGSHNLISEENVFVPLQNISLPVSVFWRTDNENPSLKSFLSFVIEHAAVGSKKPECLMDVMLL